MARPRVIKMADGEVSLMGFTTEKADELEKMLKGEQDKSIKHYGETPDVAVGLSYDKTKKLFQLVTLEYNLDTKECKINKSENAGEYKSFALNYLKIAFVRLFEFQ